MKSHNGHQAWADSLDKSTELTKTDMQFGTSLYRAGSLMADGKELLKYKLDLHRVQKVRWGRIGTKPVNECTFFYGKSYKNNELGTFYVGVCLRGSHQQLEGHSLLVIGCHTYYQEVAGVILF
jgi:hypothetical protein